MHVFVLQKNPDELYVKLTPIQADVLSSNKINIPGGIYIMLLPQIFLLKYG